MAVVSGGGVTGILVVVEEVTCRGRTAGEAAALEGIGLGGGIALVVGGIKVRVDRGVEANTVRVQLTRESVDVVLVQALTVKVRWTVTVVGRGAVGRGEVALTEVVLVTVTVKVVVSSCGSRAACSMAF